MTGLRLAFFKLNVPAMEPALAFWREAFGFEIAMSFDEAEFAEHVLALPLQPAPNLMLVCFKDGREVAPGRGHGAVGLACDHIAAAHAKALQAGAVEATGIFSVGPVQVAILQSPQGHEIELVQLPPG